MPVFFFFSPSQERHIFRASHLLFLQGTFFLRENNTTAQELLLMSFLRNREFYLLYQNSQKGFPKNHHNIQRYLSFQSALSKAFRGQNPFHMDFREVQEYKSRFCRKV